MLSLAACALSRLLGDAMARWHLVVPLVAFGALLVGGGIWLRASLAASFAQGEAYGRALAAAQAAVALTQQNMALEAIRRGAEQGAVALETQRDELQERFHDLEKALVSAGASRVGSSDPCLDAGVVRALNALGGAGADSRAP